MIRILIRFWPVLIPVLLCLLWILHKRRKAVRAGEVMPRFSEGPWYWVAIASIVIAVVCFMVLGLSNTPVTGTYEPAHVEGGKIIPGSVAP